MRRTALLLLAAALLAGLAGCGSHRAGGPSFVAKRARTPGALNPDVTQASIGRTICISGYSASIRPPVEYTSALKVRQMAEYGFGGSPHDYEEDHFIPLSLGGHPTDPRNLWPEVQPRATDVDRDELALHEDVCAGRLSLAEAQARMAKEKWEHG